MRSARSRRPVPRRLKYDRVVETYYHPYKGARIRCDSMTLSPKGEYYRHHDVKGRVVAVSIGPQEFVPVEFIPLRRRR